MIEGVKKWIMKYEEDYECELRRKGWMYRV